MVLHIHTKEYGKDSISHEYYRVHVVHLQKLMCTTIHNEQFYVHINILSSISVGIINQVISSDCNLNLKASFTNFPRLSMAFLFFDDIILTNFSIEGHAVYLFMRYLECKCLTY